MDGGRCTVVFEFWYELLGFDMNRRKKKGHQGKKKKDREEVVDCVCELSRSRQEDMLDSNQTYIWKSEGEEVRG